MNEFVESRPRDRRSSVVVLALLLLFAFIATAGDDEDDDGDDDAGARGTLVEVVAGRTRVHLEPDTLARFGITVGAANIEHHVAEQLVFGETLDSAAILAARNTYAAARAARESAAATVGAQRALISRLTAMREQGLAVDTIALAREQRQLTDFIAAQRRSGFALESARQSALVQFGTQFGTRIMTPDDSMFEELLAGERHVISVPVRFAGSVNSPVFIGRSGQRADAVAGNWIGPDARSRVPLGASYLVTTADPRLRNGMRVSVWLSNPDAAFDALRVPRRALVWHAGARWIYVELAAGVFERRRARVSATDTHTALLEPGAEPMSRVVIAGATSLLGEEFRWSIPDEDDD